MKPEETKYKDLFDKELFKVKEEGLLPVDDTHKLKYRRYGTKGKPTLVVLHGGPGAGCIYPKYAQIADPNEWDIILFDQRGAPESKPMGELEDNTTWHLIADIEKLREHLKIKKWTVAGGSWGSTLALTYAICHSDKVEAMILRGIFLATAKELDYLYGPEGHAATLKGNEEEYQSFLELVPKELRGSTSSILNFYKGELTSGDETKAKKSAAALSRWEAHNSFSGGNEAERKELLEEEFKWSQSAEGLTMGKIEAHYFGSENGEICFLPIGKEGYIIDNINKLPKVPTFVTQGRNDNVCPFESAKLLVQKLKECGHTDVTLFAHDQGHSADEKPNKHYMVTATKTLVAKRAPNIDPAAKGATSIWQDPNPTDQSGKTGDTDLPKLQG